MPSAVETYPSVLISALAGQPAPQEMLVDLGSENPHLPHNHVQNRVVYTGTHDNNTTRGWFEALPDDQRRNLWKYLRRSSGESREAAPALMRLAWSSPAALAIAPLQDLLNLGAGARMNVPGSTEGDWCWRCTETMVSARLLDGYMTSQKVEPSE